MTKNPWFNAFGAALYIFGVVTVMTLVTRPLRDTPDTFFAPIVVLFVLTLSAAVMAYVFFYQPILLIIDGKKKDAVDLFLRTVGIFAVITVLLLILLYARVL